MSLLRLTGISKRNGKNQVLNDISFSIKASDKLAIAGATGSGKTSLLKIAGGMMQYDTGEVLFGNEIVEGPDEKLLPGHPGIAYLSQHFELLNNYRVEELLEYANLLSVEEAMELYQLCRITHLLSRRIDQLSGGERQRIAMARLLSGSPKLLLLDEPFSNLDAEHKNILKAVIADLGIRLGITCILVSHDPADILSWAKEIIVLKEGRIIQKGSPEQIYRYPVDEYTAALFGNYQLISGEDNLRLFVRPEYYSFVAENSTAIKGNIKEISFFGSYYEIEIVTERGLIKTKSTFINNHIGDTVFIKLNLPDTFPLHNL